MAPKNRSEEEVQALVGAVKEHKKVKQLACYSIEALSKNLALPNTRWREYIDLAIEANAAKVVVDVIKQHPGKEDVLLTATNCLAKLAVSTVNADVIAREGGVQAILLSIEANPELDSQGDAFTRALELLNGLCDHQRTLAAVADSDMVARLLKMLQARVRSCLTRHPRATTHDHNRRVPEPPLPPPSRARARPPRASGPAPRRSAAVPTPIVLCCARKFSRRCRALPKAKRCSQTLPSCARPRYPHSMRSPRIPTVAARTTRTPSSA